MHSHFILLTISAYVAHDMSSFFFFFHISSGRKTISSKIDPNLNLPVPTLPSPSPFLSLSGDRRCLSLSPALSLSVSGKPTFPLSLSGRTHALSLSSDEPTISLRPQLLLRRRQTQLLAYSPRALSLRSLLQVRRLGISDFSLCLRQPHPPLHRN